jgi:hypothetical protein
VASLTASSHILPERKAWALAQPLGGKENRYLGVSHLTVCYVIYNLHEFHNILNKIVRIKFIKY